MRLLKSKITEPSWVKHWVIRSDSPDFGKVSLLKQMKGVGSFLVNFYSALYLELVSRSDSLICLVILVPIEKKHGSHKNNIGPPVNPIPCRNDTTRTDDKTVDERYSQKADRNPPPPSRIGVPRT